MFEWLEKIKEYILSILTNRLTLLSISFAAMAGILIYRCFDLQIVHGQEYLDQFVLEIEKTRDISSSRGSIRDRNGAVLAYDELAYSVKMEDVFESGRNKNAQMNETILRLIRLIEKNGDHVITSFNVILDEDGEYVFNVEGTRLLRFLADVYGLRNVGDLTPEQKSSTAWDVLRFLGGSGQFAIGAYEEEGNSKSDFIVGKGYTPGELLKMITIRYAMQQTSFRKYIGTTVAKDISDETLAVVMENMSDLPGVSIEEDTVRRYNDSTYFSHILGYTGAISNEEVESLNAQDLEQGGSGERYSINDVVGKSGIEAYMETTLQGTKGYETVFVDNMGKVISIIDRKEPQAGQDVYLTIDSTLQKAVYHILEQHIAGVLLDKIVNLKEVNTSGSSDIKIPIYDVYFAVINNSLIDITHFAQPDAGGTEQAVEAKYQEYKEEVYQKLLTELTETKTPYEKLTLEYKVYQSDIVSLLYRSGIIDSQLVDTNDKTYQDWTTREVISLNEYLYYCISQNWVDVTKLDLGEPYADSEEIFSKICGQILQAAEGSLEFQKKIYRFMIKNDVLSGREVCQILCEQQKIEIPEDEEEKLFGGTLSPYQFMRNRISHLDITPAQLALDPCNGSVVITDVNTGEVLAMVTYPEYDNNKMANSVDADYYAKLLADKTSPLLNYATQYKAAPGSTFKMVSATAALCEGLITLQDTVTCTGQYTQITPSPWCWRHAGHGALNVMGAIQNSCNFFFYDVGYRFATQSGSYVAQDGLDVLAKYADLYGLTDKSGVEIDEYTPEVSDELPVPSAIGQGTNSFTAVGLARYVATVANGGNCYNLTLLDAVKDTEGNVTAQFHPTLRNRVDMPAEFWNAIHQGMRKVVEGKTYFDNLAVHVAGKTGTAQQIASRPNHALFVGYAPYEAPQVAIVTRIPFGYSSDYAAQTSRDILAYYFGLAQEEDVVTGEADAPDAGVSNNEI